MKYIVKRHVIIIILFIFILSYMFFNYKDIFSYAIRDKDNLTLILSKLNPIIDSISSDPKNTLILKVETRDNTGLPVPCAKVTITTDEKYGNVSPSTLRTGSDGSALLSFNPSGYIDENVANQSNSISIKAELDGLGVFSSISVILKKNPVIFVHGYQASSTIFSNMSDYLITKGFPCLSINYNSENGVISGASELGSYLLQQKLALLVSGFQVSRFDLICHSMGGLVARYYSCNTNYIYKNDIRKIIFISTPQKGSVWASLGEEYFNNQAIRDLIPGSPLFTDTFLYLINKGLNSSIQTASIIGQYDEVVSVENASLEDWKIKTTIFNVGESNMSMKNILDGSVLESANHKAVLNNTKIFETITNMLNKSLPYPSKRK